jgi:hypothetical protein
LDRGKTFKGQLHYVAEFVPAWDIRGVEFQGGVAVDGGAAPSGTIEEVEGEEGNHDGDDDAGSTVEGGSSSEGSLEQGGAAAGRGPVRVTASRPLAESPTRPNMEETSEHAANGVEEEKKKGHKSTKSTDTTRTAESGMTKEGEEKVEEGVLVTKDELLKQRKLLQFYHNRGSVTDVYSILFIESGVLVVHVKSARLAKKARLEVLLDEGYWPSFSTPRARGAKENWMFVGEAFVKELDFGRVVFRLNEADEGDKDEVIAEWKGDTKTFLTQTMVSIPLCLLFLC